MTFDNVAEIHKCASVSKKIQLIMRIITDDSGSQCRLSSKFGAPRQHWRELMREAKNAGLEVVGVSFHVGSGCRDATRYEMALKDCKELFGIAKEEFGFDMKILDIGGGFPGETHSLWNPATVSRDFLAISYYSVSRLVSLELKPKAPFVFVFTHVPFFSFDISLTN